MRRSRSLVAVAALLVGAGLAPLVPSGGKGALRHGAGTGTPRCLAFAAGTSPSHIYVVNEGGVGLRRLTSGPHGGFSPSWSADGRRLAFRAETAAGDRLYLIDADGSNEREWRLPGHPEGLAWSPGGRRIAYSGGATDDENTAGDIYVANADGTDRQRVSGRPRYTNEFPSWSGGGRRLTFASTHGALGDERALWLVKVDGTGRRLLASAGAHSSWRPNGRQIVFSSARRARGAFRRLWTVTPAGARSRPLRSLSGEFPAWSPDGRRLAFTAPSGGIGITDARGLHPRRIVSRLGFAGWPAWRPGGCP
jgi:Tol biopolymer transport system component